jgi:hypothetical protein
MTPLQIRTLLFLIGCIGTRVGLALAARALPPNWLPYAGAVALIPAIGFFTIYLFDLRKTGPEVFGDRIWWNSLRPLHGTLYAAFAYLAFQKDPRAWMILAADAAVGLGAFLQNRFSTA